ncbi:MAG: YcaO-like family protein [Deltaproteobacteria bacterium]|jgi:ribosomal protein S12 methylthiotransferase accessory factor YcaO|nr:YcaO-like family protein [Deltaproteobacteria bacterium]
MTIHYTYAHSATEGTTGYFSCEPAADISFERALALLESAPQDEFLHRHLLRRCTALPLADLEALAPRALRGEKALAALLLECALLAPHLAPLAQRFAPDAATRFCASSPLIHLRWRQLEDRALHQAWNELFAANQTQLHPMPHPEDSDLPFPYADADSDRAAPVTLAQLCGQFRPPPGEARPPARETAALALERLEEHGLLAGQEMRHEASLSPIALLRSWKLAVSVRNGALDYSLRGTATSYGRGLSLAAARASCLMEIVERASSYLSVNGDELPQLARPARLVRERFSRLRDRAEAIDPAALLPDVPYRDEALHWMPAAAARDGRAVLVPLQAVGLFCNLDEPALFEAPGSTGLASGNTWEEAKESALTEILERDAEATTPYRRTLCFELCAQRPDLAALLEDYAARGIRIRFQSLTSEFGMPCFACFVVGNHGEVARACGAGLDGGRAALAALTETPWPYPNGPLSGPGLRGLPQRLLEKLPVYDQGSAAANSALLEQVLLANGCEPLYVDLTRADLRFPVLRALVPGLAATAPGAFGRVNRRLFANYLKSS